MLAGLQAEGTTEVHEPAVSRDHTERMLVALGAPLHRIDDRTVQVTRGAPSSFSLELPGDPSSAAFFAVAAAITGDSELVLPDVLANPVVSQLKADVSRAEANLQQLSTRYGDNHPQVIEAKASVADTRAKLNAEMK